MRKQCVILEDNPDVSLVGRDMRDIPPLQVDLTSTGLDQSSRDHQCGGLAGPARTEQSQELPTPNPQVERVKNLMLRIALRDPTELKAITIDGGCLILHYKPSTVVRAVSALASLSSQNLLLLCSWTEILPGDVGVTATRSLSMY